MNLIMNLEDLEKSDNNEFGTSLENLPSKPSQKLRTYDGSLEHF